MRVHDLVPRATWSRRYAQINDFEAKAVADGTTIVKVMLNISSDEQKARLTERLERPDKHWKYNPGDVDERLHWPEYQAAYQAVFEKTSTEAAPWFVVPADRKWYARLAVQNLVLEHLARMDPAVAPGGLRRGGREAAAREVLTCTMSSARPVSTGDRSSTPGREQRCSATPRPSAASRCPTPRRPARSTPTRSGWR